MSDTSDPQAPYGKNREAFGKIMDDALAKAEATERALLLSDGQMNDLIGGWGDGGWKVRDFYESKITSGELRVVKTIPRSEARDHVLNCHEDMASAMDTGFANYILFCPGCGAQIVK